MAAPINEGSVLPTPGVESLGQVQRKCEICIKRYRASLAPLRSGRMLTLRLSEEGDWAGAQR